MQPNMAGEDPSLDGAVAAIAAKLRKQDEPDTRESREDRDDIEREGSNDLDQSDRDQREALQDGESQNDAEAEAEAGEKSEGEAEAFIELPAAEDGGEPERVPLTEAIEAVKQLRQMNGDVATAVIKAEEEAFAKQDQITKALNSTFETVAKQAQVALQVMHAYAPQPPDPIMLDRNGGYYDPEGYHNAKIHYDAFVAHYNKVLATVQQAESGKGAIGTQEEQEFVRRETDRAARFIPEFKDEKARAAKRAEWLEVLGPRYGVSAEDLAGLADHKALRMVNDLTARILAEKKAPEVKKHLTETKPRIVNGRVSQSRDPQTGQFVNQARKELKETGSEAAFAKLLLRRGL